MQDLILIVLGSILANNFVLAPSLGLRADNEFSSRSSSFLSIGMTATTILVVSSCINQLATEILLRPFKLDYLSILIFIISILSVAKTLQISVIWKRSRVNRTLWVRNPVITIDCAILGLTLLRPEMGFSILDNAIMAFLLSFSYALILIIFAAIDKQTTSLALPQSFKGPPITLINIGILSMACMGLL
tara:strand:+ start:326 stop:892 length:567 start_codon:yes stop_codon:yes gene_type:complete